MFMNDDAINIVLGGLLGIGLALPNATDREAIKYYNSLRQFIENRKSSLGDILISKKIIQDRSVNNTLNEAMQMYLYGSNKGSSFLCIAILESKLREKYGLRNFEELIERAKDEKIFSNSEYHFLNGLRIDRNSIAHNVFADFTENDAQITFKLVIRLLNHIYK